MGLDYEILEVTHFLSWFGLPQKRERALVVAVKKPLPLLDLKDLWSGYRLNKKATHVRRAIWELAPIDTGEPNPDDPMHVAPAIRTDVNRRRLAATPHDGGGWVDLIEHAEADELLTPSMKYRASIRTSAVIPTCMAAFGGIARQSPSSGSAAISGMDAMRIPSKTGYPQFGKWQYCKAFPKTTHSPEP